MLLISGQYDNAHCLFEIRLTDQGPVVQSTISLMKSLVDWLVGWLFWA